ncbi:MAG: hypothetical protein GAK28_00558 [Luteibacter sp.]|uniref:hypothetical protein n=1 Tax=Luteibacter sp. TaxID=1886636 RepID=UPI00138508E7|nr:hypothetical protein [Luteibacter sp.]KAF1008926.1 MAG: hypothetical protein GAK28_00558 [Luteibacter sp.]
MHLALPDGTVVTGRVRVIAPSVEVANRHGRIVVDLPYDAGTRAGMFAQGQFELSQAMVMALPQSVIEVRDGTSYVIRILPATRVTLGRRLGDRIEVLTGLQVGERIVASGATFLAKGDPVRVVGAAMLLAQAIRAPGAN